MDLNKAKEKLKARGIDNAFEDPKPSTIEISREDFELLDIEEDVMYHIIEEDGTITIKKGVNR